MILSCSSSSSLSPSARCSSNRTPRVNLSSPSDHPPSRVNANRRPDESPAHLGSSCTCGRRRLFIEAAATSLLPFSPSNASNYTTMLEKVHPPRPDWYEEFYASVLDTSMKAYEAEISGYKAELFANLKGKAQKVLEIGIGTGPNLRYYAGNDGVQVFGVDPNRKMEKYAKAAAAAAGLPPLNFKFIQAFGVIPYELGLRTIPRSHQAEGNRRFLTDEQFILDFKGLGLNQVGEALPLGDAFVDAIVGTLVLCSVKDANMTLKEVKRVLKPGGLFLFVEHVAAKEGTTLRFIQRILDPLQQTLSDGCHLTRETGNHISEAGFSDLKLSTAFLSNASLVNPHIYGIACK